MRRPHFYTKQGVFTLIEVMLVIVIMAVMAGLVVINIQGIEHRKVLQSREVLLMDLQKIRLESLDQGRILGLVPLLATDVAPAGYQVVEYVKKSNIQNTNPALIRSPSDQYVWQVASDFKMQALPSESYLTVQMSDQALPVNALKTSQQQNLPAIIWLGNGENLPARLQLFVQQQAVGEVIEVNRLGLIANHEN